MNWNTFGAVLLPYLRAFLIGGGLCVIAQILIDKTAHCCKFQHSRQNQTKLFECYIFQHT